MIVRDWQRLAFNLVLGPPVAYLAGLAAICIMLAIAALATGSDTQVIVIVLFLAIPSLFISYVYGLAPSLFTAIFTTIFARIIPTERGRIWSGALTGAVPHFVVAMILVGPGRTFDSAEFNGMLLAAAPIGGAVAGLTCTAFTEWFGSRRGLPEGYL